MTAEKKEKREGKTKTNILNETQAAAKGKASTKLTPSVCLKHSSTLKKS